MKKMFSALALATSLALGATAVQAAEDKSGASAAPQKPVQGKTANPFDPSAWFNAAGHAKPGQMVAINPADPDFWMRFADPKTHNTMHMAMSNPATYGQMMRPGFYMQMMNPATWMKWMNPSSYAVAMDPKTAVYWMQPGAYVHNMDPAGYMQAMNPDAYAKMMAQARIDEWMNPAAYNISTATGGSAGAPSFFDPFSWMNMFTAASSGVSGPKEKS